MDKALIDEVVWRYKNPSHRRTAVGMRLRAENLSCGDDITLYVAIEEGVVKNTTHSGEYCSICNYGAELLAEKIVGMNIEEARKIGSEELLGAGGESLLQNPVRLKCFELAQRALDKLTGM